MVLHLGSQIKNTEDCLLFKEAYNTVSNETTSQTIAEFGIMILQQMVKKRHCYENNNPVNVYLNDQSLLKVGYY